MGYQVVAPYVTMPTATPYGKRIVGLNTGAPVPSDVPESVIQHHLKMGLIVELPEVAAEPVLAVPEPVVKAAARSSAVRVKQEG